MCIAMCVCVCAHGHPVTAAESLCPALMEIGAAPDSRASVRGCWRERASVLWIASPLPAAL